MFIKWSEIEGFHNVFKTVRKYPELLREQSVVKYKAKIKIHGTNAAVQIKNDGSVVAQSRTSIISPSKDNAGFARWVEDNKDKWQNVSKNIIIFGEFAGPGIQSGVAVNKIPNKIFAVFSARRLNENGAEDELITDPVLLSDLVKDIPNVFVLPWHEKEFTLDFSKTKEDLSKDLEEINNIVLQIEKEDPWIKEIFNVSGIGEGLVFYPVSKDHIGAQNFSNLAFKAKGEKHKVVKTKSPVQVDAESVATIEQFVDLVLPEARLEQGVTQTSTDGSLSFDIKLTGSFVNWIMKDVEKETQDELEASGLTWEQVKKYINDRARKWYVAKTRTI